MKKCLILTFLLLLPFFSVAAGEQKLYEIPGTQVIPIQDPQSGGQYELYVKLPEKYADDSEKHYPVIYFTDAVWQIELLSASTAFLMEEVILVGISWQKDIDEKLKNEVGAHVSRFRDYSITQSSDPVKQAKYQFGQASHHLAFIRNHVIQHVEKNYRTKPESRTYFGFSLGGLFGAYILLSEPDTFKNYILGSPSVWQLAELESKADLKRKSLNANLFISHGNLETKLSKHINDFIAVLKNRNDETLSLTPVVIEGSHQTAFPMTGIRSVNWLANLQQAEDK